MYNLAAGFRATVCMKLGSKQASKLDPQPTLKREARKNKQGIAVYIQQRKVGKEGSLDSPILSSGVRRWCDARYGTKIYGYSFAGKTIRGRARAPLKSA